MSKFKQISFYKKKAIKVHRNTLKSPDHRYEIFDKILFENLNVYLPLKNSVDIEEAIEYLHSSIHTAAWSSSKQQTLKKVPLNPEVEAMIKEKRKVRKSWQNTRDPSIKSKLNRFSKDLKSTPCQIENVEMTDYLQGLTAIEATD